MTDPAPVATLSFEAAMSELEAIVRQLEAGDAPLDASVDLYTRGEALKKHCEARLAAAQARIELITVGPDGAAAGTRPLDADG
ncbi:MAG: exodeoxyribonuclease VII small subunit [Sphingomonadales bacterium]|nr:exodeoxyribonuclease VII small subunit [Sphingomonadales bacterium]